ncbi:hypothetical protein PsorP6_012265 [Peronosclerospora sorghi]|uniref:Uncharacterized protein n=1 Tax=Peronosclerospora sorghi TaxID=230839 RepID=A0ACC0WJD5_9STRA|nr:hypothetical protein PsorP6_012265 [Peronosclerospora sorghi]
MRTLVSQIESISEIVNSRLHIRNTPNVFRRFAGNQSEFNNFSFQDETYCAEDCRSKVPKGSDVDSI